MPGRHLGIALLLAAATGCAAAPAPGRFQAARPADPDRFDRAACLRGDYPTEVDGAAYAQARTVDWSAQRSGQASPGATGKLMARRAAFESRCAGWRQAGGTAAAPAVPVVHADLAFQR
jgi:hypothetical protein